LSFKIWNRLGEIIDKTITLGYLHDIGKYNGEPHGHEMTGYNYLKDKGYIDKRLIDIMIRRGAYSNTQYHIIISGDMKVLLLTVKNINRQSTD